MHELRIGVIGAGIVGASIAHHLSQKSGVEVSLFEAGTVGQGSTARSVGGIRTLFAQPLETQMSLFSLDAFKALNRGAARPFGFNEAGYLLLVSDALRAAKQDSIIEQARGFGVTVEDLDAAALRRLIPGIVTDDIVRAMHCPRDGFVPDPAGAALAYTALAVGSGRTVLHENTPIDAVTPQGEGFQVRSGERQWSFDRIVIALNAYAGPILAGLGVRLASHPYPRHVFRIEPVPQAINPDMPMTVFQDGDILFRFDGTHLTSIVGVPAKSSTDLSLGEDVLANAGQRISERLALAGSDVTHAWSGLRAMTPDRRALVGALPNVPGAWCAIGFSGHGFMHAPAVGLALSELMLDGRSRTFDITGFDPARFADVGEAPVLEAQHH